MINAMMSGKYQDGAKLYCNLDWYNNKITEFRVCDAITGKEVGN